MPSADDLAQRCRQNLQFSLAQTNTLTKDVNSPLEYLLNRMGAVLGAVVESNFGSASHSRIDDLYTAISELPVALFDSSSSTAFVHFARAFAVVMEESCMQRMEKRQQRCVDNREPPMVNSNATPSTVSPSTIPCSAVVPSTVLVSGLKSKVLQQAKSTPAASGRGAGAPHPKNDYSPQAVKGAIVVGSLEASATRTDLIPFLQRVGPLKALAFPLYTNKSPFPYALAKYERVECAQRAIAELHRAPLKGRPASVSQARYWIEVDRDRVTREEQGDVSESAPRTTPPTTSTPQQVIGGATEENNQVVEVDSDDDSVD